MTEPKYLAVPVIRHGPRQLCMGCAFWATPASYCQIEFRNHIGHSCAPGDRLTFIAIENIPEAIAKYVELRLEAANG